MSLRFSRHKLVMALLASSVLWAPGSHAAYSGVTQAYNQLSTSTDPAVQAFDTDLQALPSDLDRARALSSLAPISDGSLMLVSINNVERGMHLVQDRMEKVRMGYVMPKGSYSAGDWDTGTGGWIQLFGNDINQKDRNGIQGYNAWSAGISVGFDQEVMKQFIVGGGFSFAYSDIDSKMFTNNHVDIQSYQGFVYGSWKADESFYVDALMSLGFHDYNSVRHIVVPGTEATPPGFRARSEGDFGAWQFGFFTEAGYEWLYQNWLITPHMNFKYSKLNVHTLREEGAGALGLMVDYDDVSEAVLGAGLKAGYVAELAGGMEMMPHVFGQVFYDFVHDRQESTASFYGGGTSFVTPGIQPAATGVRLGLGVDFAAEDDWCFSLKYDFTFKHDYLAHGGFLKLRYEWA